jgi:flagellin-like protein
LRTYVTTTGRGVSPVIGVVLLIAITLLLVSVSVFMIFGITDEQDPAPQATFALEATETSGTYRLVHESGDTIDGNRLTIFGVSTTALFAGEELVAGSAETVRPEDSTVRIVWDNGEQDADTYTISELSVPTVDPGAGALADFGDGAVRTKGSSNDIRIIEGDGGETAVRVTSNEPGALGPVRDIDSDGVSELPYVTTGGDIKTLDGDGTTETLATGSDVSGGGIRGTKTKLAVGSWDGTPTSVLFVDTNDNLWGVEPDGTTTQHTSGTGVQAVVGIADMDGDGDDDLIYAGSSQTVKYLDSSGSSPESVANGDVGSNSAGSGGIGVGRIADFDGDGTVQVVAASTGNDIKLIGESTGDGGEGTRTITAPNVQKASVSTGDVDGDGDLEIVYVDKSTHNLRYIDDVGGGETDKQLADDGGAAVSGSEGVGVG